MRSSFVFGHSGKPSLTHTVCSRTPLCQKEPVRSWFKTLIDLPYGGWGFYARLHCHTYLDLSPVFNYWTGPIAHRQHVENSGLVEEFQFFHSNQNYFIPQDGRRQA